MGKSGVTKGGKIIVLSHAYRTCPRAYVHRRKYHEPIAAFTQQGPLEGHMIMDYLKRLIKNEESDRGRQIFMERSCSNWANLFSGDEINDWIGLIKNDFGATMTCQKDTLPKGLPNYSFHKILMAPGDKKAHVACFSNPTTVVKYYVPVTPAGQGTEGENNAQATPPIKYTNLHVTFQPTVVPCFAT